MRIRLVGPVHPYKGGIAQHTTHLAHELAKAGHDTVVESWRRQYPDAIYPGQQRVDETEVVPYDRTRYRLSWNSPVSWILLGRRLRAEADLVVIVLVSPVQVPPYLVALGALGRKHRPRLVVLVHNVLPHERGQLDRFAIRSLMRHADQVLVHSQAQRDLAKTLTSAPIVVRPLAPHLPTPLATGLPPAVGPDVVQRHLLFFGLVRRYKGVDLLVRALVDVPDVTLTIAGEFWRGAEEVHEAIEEMGVGDRVELRPGYVPAHEIPELFERADALVLPYREATSTQNVALAFSYGRPVVATTVGTLPELVRDRVDGLLCPPDDVAALATTLRELYEPGVWKRLRAGVAPVDSRAPWQAYVDALVVPAGDSPHVR